MQRRNLRAWHRWPGSKAWREVERWQCGIVAGHERIRKAKQFGGAGWQSRLAEQIGRAKGVEAGHIA
ncbi:hypothetical protein Tamer19_71090 [Cupriavidus sp. TA19]|nr:hypothetical protein Tamer19_71090 [Cupriavidus sp. TA19]